MTVTLITIYRTICILLHPSLIPFEFVSSYYELRRELTLVNRSLSAKKLTSSDRDDERGMDFSFMAFHNGTKESRHK